MADNYNDQDLYGNYQYTEGEVPASLSALEAMIRNLRVKSAQIESIAAEKLEAGGVIANDITFTGKLQGATGEFNGDVNINTLDGGFINIDADNYVSVKRGDSMRWAFLEPHRLYMQNAEVRKNIKYSAEGIDFYDTTSGVEEWKASIGFDNSLDAIAFYGTFYHQGRQLINPLFGTTRIYQTADNRMAGTVTHNLGSISHVQLTPLFYGGTGQVSMDALKTVYMENSTASTFQIMATGSGIPAGAWLDVMWMAYQ